MTSAPARLRIERRVLDDGVMLVEPHGVLDLGTYTDLRDALIKCAVEQPRALVVDVESLWVPTGATLTVFTAVWTRISAWPGVPMALVAAHPVDRERLRRSTVSRHISVHPTAEDACRTVGRSPRHRRTRLDLPCSAISSAVARWFVGETCLRWECVEVLPSAIMVASELVENAVQHANSDPRLCMELRRGMLTIAVYDDSPPPAELIERDRVGARHLGLTLVTHLASAWSCAPLWSGGKVVWAVLQYPATG